MPPLRTRWMPSLPQLVFLLFFLAQSGQAYWQQEVDYQIDVTLNDSTHVLTGSQLITYINHSPDTLKLIWMHLWPNAYSSNQTPLAREKFNQYSTRMVDWEEEDFGWIRIDSVRTTDYEIKWQYRSPDSTDVARFNLPQPLAPADTIRFALNFELKIPSMVSRLGHRDTHYEMTQWYPKPAVYDATGWHPMSYLEQGEFYSEWADFEVSITLPVEYRVAATGMLQDDFENNWLDSLAAIGNKVLRDMSQTYPDAPPQIEITDSSSAVSLAKMKTITFHQGKVHDFAWFADPRYMVTNDSTHLASGKPVFSWLFCLPENLEAFRYSHRYAGQTLRAYSNWFMEYPYDRVTIVDGDSSPGGGMEYPMITLINGINFQPIMELSIMHEIGHNWFYGLLGTNERRYPWLDEGLNSYAENRYWKRQYPQDQILAFSEETPGYVKYVNLFLRNATKTALEESQYFVAAKPDIDQAPNLHSSEFSRSNYGAMTYKKAAFATETLHNYLGETVMDSLWRSFFQNWAFMHPQPNDLRVHFEQGTGADLSWYFDDLIGSTGKVDYGLKKIESGSGEAQNKVQLLITNYGDIAPPLSIGFQGPTGNIDSLYWLQPSLSKEIVQIKTDFAITGIQLDPYNKLLDMDRRNNRLKRKVDFNFMKLDLNPDGNYVINTIPYLWYSSVNELFPGVIVMHDDLNDWGGIDWYTRTSYGAVTNTLGLIASLGKTVYPGQGHILKINTRYGHDWYYELIELSASYARKYPFSPRDQQTWRLAFTNMDVTGDGFLLDGERIYDLDPAIWDHDHSYRLELDHLRSKVKTLDRSQYGLTIGYGNGRRKGSWAKFQTYLEVRKRHSRTLTVASTFFMGFAWGDVPGQERFYLSTDMDPALDNGLVLSRNNAWYAPGHVQLYTTPYTIPGFLFNPSSGTIPSTTGLMGAKSEFNLRGIAGLKTLVGGGIHHNADTDRLDGYGSLSIVYDLGPWRLYLTPIRLETGKLELDITRFQLSFDMPSGGSFLGF